MDKLDRERVLFDIAKWIEQLPESHEPSDRGFGKTTSYITYSRESLAKLIRAQAWEHAPRCMINRSSGHVSCDCGIVCECGCLESRHECGTDECFDCACKKMCPTSSKDAFRAREPK